MRIAALALVLLIPSGAVASDLTLAWTLPCWNDSLFAGASTDCVADSGNYLHDLALTRFRFTRFKFPGDTLALDVMTNQASGCTDVGATFDILAGSMGVAEARAVDFNGHESCPVTYVYAVPAQLIEPGLLGEYYDNEDFSAWKFNRVDSKVDFDWDLGSPDSRIGPDVFSIVWTGFIIPAFSGSYAFHTRIEDGCKLWVGSTFVTSDWGVQNEHESTGTATLTAGIRYAVRMEYMAHNGTSMARLSWTPPGGVKAVIPPEALTH